MWVLVQTTPGDDGVVRRFYLCTGRTYVVGRKEEACQILVENDKSISRAHAEVALKLDGFDIKDASTRPAVVVTDTSVYGTELNKEPLIKGEATTISEGDVVQFGVFKSSFRLEWLPVVVCLSKTTAETKKKVRNSLVELGSHITMTLMQATHVITDTIHPTFVSIGALLRAIPIITSDWLSSFTTRATLRTPPPPTTMFTPPPAPIWANLTASLQATPARAGANLFHENRLRLELFANMQFCFIDAGAYAANHQIIELGKGIAYDASGVDFLDRAARNGFFIRHQAHIVVYDSAQGAAEAGAAPAAHPSGIVRRMGFTAVDQSAIVTAVLVASTEELRSIRQPFANALDAGSLGPQNSGWVSSAATRIDTLGPGTLSAPDAQAATTDTVGNTHTTPRAKRARSGTRGGSGDEAVALAEVTVKVEGGSAEAKRRRTDPRGRAAAAQRGAEQPTMGTTGGVPAPHASAGGGVVGGHGGVPPQPRGDGGVGSAGTPGPPPPAADAGVAGDPDPAWVSTCPAVAQDHVRMVVTHDPAMFYNTAFPCFAHMADDAGAAVPQYGGGGGTSSDTGGKTFCKQELAGGLRQGLDHQPAMEEFVNDVPNPQVLVTQNTTEIQYEDLIALRPEAVRRRGKTSGRSAAGVMPLPRTGAVNIVSPASKTGALRVSGAPAARGKPTKRVQEKKAVIDPFDFNSDED